MGLISRVSSRTYRTIVIQKCPPHETESTFRSTAERRLPPPSPSARPARASSRSTDDRSTKSSQKLYDSSLRSPFSLSARTDSAPLTSKSRSAVVDEWLRSTPSDAISRSVVAYYQKYVDEHSKILK